MVGEQLLSLSEIESRICDIAAEQCVVDRATVDSGLRIVQDLHCDSIEFLELILKVEEAFDFAWQNDPTEAVSKSVFTRNPLRLADLAEIVFLQQNTGRVKRSIFSYNTRPTKWRENPFTQLGGRATLDRCACGPLFETIGRNAQGYVTRRRRTDGMICVEIPGGSVVLGSNVGDGLRPDEQPSHSAKIDHFLIDREPVSTTAYCRFLNSLGLVASEILREWFVLAENDKRQQHMPLRKERDQWVPLPRTARLPMILVSWYGASAYSLWANRRDWRAFRDDLSFLPSEAQWEYAARGTQARTYPWGDDDPTPERMRYAQHEPGRTYGAEELPIAEVNAELGVSPFGLNHMAGNVWQWCQDWYAPNFYSSSESIMPNPVNRHETGIRSERGGSWIGPAFLCRSSYRRGRVPSARGRCLGFRCVSRLD